MLFHTRLRICCDAIHSGRPDTSLVYLAQVLATHDREPERFGHRYETVLWEYKNTLGALPRFLNISRKQIEDSLADFHRRLVAENYGVRSYHGLRLLFAMNMGRLEEAEAELPRWEVLPRDRHTDCLACEINKKVEYYYQRREWPAVIATAAPLLRPGGGCLEVPHLTYPMLGIAHHALGEETEARRAISAGLRLLQPANHLLACGEMMLALLRLGEVEKAVRLLERTMLPALKAGAELYWLRALVGAPPLLQRLIEEKRRFRLKFPLEADQAGLEGRRTPQELLDWLQPQLAAKAAAFDARNGNGYYSEQYLAFV